MKELPLTHVYIEELNLMCPVFKGDNDTYTCKLKIPENTGSSERIYTLRIYQDNLPSDINSVITVQV